MAHVSVVERAHATGDGSVMCRAVFLAHVHDMKHIGSINAQAVTCVRHA